MTIIATSAFAANLFLAGLLAKLIFGRLKRIELQLDRMGELLRDIQLYIAQSNGVIVGE